MASGERKRPVSARTSLVPHDQGAYAPLLARIWDAATLPPHAVVADAGVDTLIQQAEPRVGVGREEQLGVDPLVQLLDVTRDRLAGGKPLSDASVIEILVADRVQGNRALQVTDHPQQRRFDEALGFGHPRGSQRWRIVLADQPDCAVVEPGFLRM